MDSANSLSLYKICKWCKKEKPITSFHLHKAMKDGHLNKCKSCTKSWTNSYRATKYKERRKVVEEARRRKLGIKPISRTREVSKYTELVCSRCNQLKPTSLFSIRSDRTTKSYMSSCKECLNKAQKNRYLASPQKYRDLQKQQYSKNRAQYITNAKNYKARKKGAAGSYTAQEWANLCEVYNHTCPACKESKLLTADHIIPLSRGGSNYINNIQPLCLSCNSKKRTKIIKYLPAQSVYPANGL